MTHIEHQPEPVRIFCSYAPDDDRFRVDFDKAIATLKRVHLAEIWSTEQILPGKDIRASLDAAIDAADVFAPLISSSYINSDECWNYELQRALGRAQQGEIRVIPVLIKPCLLADTPLATLRALPLDGTPVTLWASQDDAWARVATGINDVIKDIRLQELRRTAPKSVRDDVSRGERLKLGRLSDDLAKLSETNPTVVFSTEELMSIADAHFVSRSVEKAVELYRKAISAAPESAAAWYKLAFALDEGWQKYEEALKYYDVSLALDPTQAEAHTDRSYVLRRLGRFSASIDAATAALKLNPSSARAAYNLACSQARAGNEDDALASLDLAISLNPLRYRRMAERDSDFVSLHSNRKFLQLLHAPALRGRAG